jgi:hypothetical protein
MLRSTLSISQGSKGQLSESSPEAFNRSDRKPTFLTHAFFCILRLCQRFQNPNFNSPFLPAAAAAASGYNTVSPSLDECGLNCGKKK